MSIEELEGRMNALLIQMTQELEQRIKELDERAKHNRPECFAAHQAFCKQLEGRIESYRKTCQGTGCDDVHKLQVSGN